MPTFAISESELTRRALFTMQQGRRVLERTHILDAQGSTLTRCSFTYWRYMSCMLLVESRTLESVQAWRLQRLALAFTLSCCVTSPVYHNACGRPSVTCELTHVSMLACLSC